MPVTYLELENFKSYAGIQRIGPFQNFTSIIGPNGSGKSNVMDALSFVLGLQSKDLRSSQMKDLIFRPPGTNIRQSRKLKASASLLYQTADGDEDDVIRFQRTISERGSGEYRIDGRAVSYKEYETKLADIGVLVKARNFLVFQGRLREFVLVLINFESVSVSWMSEARICWLVFTKNLTGVFSFIGDVEALARKSPQEFVALLEQISQSADLKDEYEKALVEKEEAEAGTLFCFNKQKGMKGERRLVRVTPWKINCIHRYYRRLLNQLFLIHS